MRVLNIRSLPNMQINPDTQVYIGRPRRHERGFHFGNPFTHIHNTGATVVVFSREQAVQCFEQWLRGEAFHDLEPDRRQWILDNLHLLKGHDLVCWCAPQACHGDVLARFCAEQEELETLMVALAEPDYHYEVWVYNTSPIEEFSPAPLGGLSFEFRQEAQIEYDKMKQRLMEQGFISATFLGLSGEHSEETVVTMVSLHKRTSTSFELLEEYDSKGFPDQNKGGNNAV